MATESATNIVPATPRNGAQVTALTGQVLLGEPTIASSSAPFPWSDSTQIRKSFKGSAQAVQSNNGRLRGELLNENTVPGRLPHARCSRFGGAITSERTGGCN